MRRPRRRTRPRAATWFAALVVIGVVCGCRPSRVAYLEQARAILPAALTSSEPAERAMALEVYRDLDMAAPESQLHRLLTDATESVRFTALLVKADQARQSELSYFDKVFREDPQASIRLAAVYGMARLGSFRYMQALSDGLNDQSAVVRRNAAMILGLLGNASAAGMLNERLNDADPVVRLNAAEAMARLGDSRGLPAIRALAEDATSPLQVNAILALGRAGVPAIDIQRLRELQTGRTPMSVAGQMATFGARAQLGDYAQVALLADIAAGREGRSRVEPQDRAFALQLLARAAYGPAWQDVGPCLDDRDGLVRLSAAWATLSFHGPRAAKVMESVSTSPSPQMLTEREVLRPTLPRPQNSESPGPLQPWGEVGK